MLRFLRLPRKQKSRHIGRAETTAVHFRVLSVTRASFERLLILSVDVIYGAGVEMSQKTRKHIVAK